MNRMTGAEWIKERPIAHRGLHDLNNQRWENTLSAFSAAMDKGYAIECDVHVSADGIPVIFHDHQLDRLTGQQGFVWQRTASELRALSVGGTSDQVPTLADMLRLVDGRVPVVIELKGIPGHDAGLVAKVAAQLRDYRGKAAIMSFDHWLVRAFATEAHGIQAGLTASGDKNYEFEAHYSMLGSGLTFVSYEVSALPNPFVQFVRDRLSMPVITWTVRDKAAVERTFAYADQMTFEGFEPALAR